MTLTQLEAFVLVARLGLSKRFENGFEIFGSDAAARIFDADVDPRAGAGQ